MRKSLFTASVLAMALAAPFAQAHQAGDIIVRAGAATVDPHEDSSTISTAATGSLAGTKATLDSDTQLGLTGTYMLTDHVGIELLAATPFQHQVSIKGMPLGLDGKLADVKHLPPTLSVQYYPLRDASHIDTIRTWIRQGVHCLSLGTDSDIVEVYRRLLNELVAT